MCSHNVSIASMENVLYNIKLKAVTYEYVQISSNTNREQVVFTMVNTTAQQILHGRLKVFLSRTKAIISYIKLL